MPSPGERGSEGWLHNQHIFRKVYTKENAEIDLEVCLLLSHVQLPIRPNFVGIARNRQTTGTTATHTSPERSRSNSVAGVPPRSDEQRAIAHILGTLDDKIELNRRMNETLEAIVAGAVQVVVRGFRIRCIRRSRMQETGLVPSPLRSCSLVVSSQSELDQVPEGWCMGELAQVAEAPRRGVSPADLQADTPYIGLEHMPRCSSLTRELGKDRSSY